MQTTGVEGIDRMDSIGAIFLVAVSTSESLPIAIEFYIHPIDFETFIAILFSY